MFIILVTGWTLECFDGWIEFYKLGLPGVGMICMEWTSFEISAFVLGTLGEVELAINTVLINTITFLFMVILKREKQQELVHTNLVMHRRERERGKESKHKQLKVPANVKFCYCLDTIRNIDSSLNKSR